MGRLLRTLMICMLALALPVQGAVAASMMLCAMQHHSRMAAVDAAQADPGCHESISSASQDHKCSVCAACHAIAALPCVVPNLPVAEPASAVFADIVAIIHPFATEGPDRPPRSIHV